MKKFLLFILGLIIGGSVLFVGGCSNQNDTRLQNGYYKEIVMDPNGIFHGENRIDDGKASESGLVYKVEMGTDKEKDQVKSITAMYGGQPINKIWKSSIHGIEGGAYAKVIISNEDGYLRYNFTDVSGKSVMGPYWANSIRFKESNDKNSKQIISAFLYDGQGNNRVQAGVSGKGGISQLLFKYDEMNQLTKISFADHEGNLTQPSYGSGKSAVTLAIAYDEKKKGQIASVSWKDKDGNYADSEYGHWVRSDYTYDDKGRMTQVIHKGEDGHLLNISTTLYALLNPFDDIHFIDRDLSKLYYGTMEVGAITKYSYTGSEVNPSEVAFFGEADQTYADKTNGISKFKLSYDSVGNLRSISAFGNDGQPHAMAKKQADTIQLEYDKFGNISQLSLFNGKSPVAVEVGLNKGSSVSSARYTYNDTRWVVSEAYFGIDEQPANLKKYGISYSKIAYERETDGKLNNTTYYTPDGSVVDIDKMTQFYGQWKGLIYRFGEDQSILWTVGKETISDGEVTDSFVIQSDSIDAVSGLGKVVVRAQDGTVVSMELKNPNHLVMTIGFTTINFSRIH